VYAFSIPPISNNSSPPSLSFSSNSSPSSSPRGGGGRGGRGRRGTGIDSNVYQRGEREEFFFFVRRPLVFQTSAIITALYTFQSKKI
tara:strand:- start:49 stop:309 length:261 start_codon:yes stop_codon:yes gene_type:complete